MTRNDLLAKIKLLDSANLEIAQREGDAITSSEYLLYPPATEDEIASYEKEKGWKVPPSFREFLKIHNGWLGFWPDWSLVGLPRKDNLIFDEEIRGESK